MQFKAIQLKSAPGALAEEILTQIKSGSLKPGTLLPSQRELAKVFKVGLGSVREAIKILEVMGCLEVIRGRGTFVSEKAFNAEKQDSKVGQTLEAVSLADLMRAREIVESGAARIAAGSADDESIMLLERIAGDMEASFSDIETFYDLDFAFHLAVAEASNNKALMEIVKMLVDKSHRYINFMTESLGIAMASNIQRAVKTARSVVVYIKAGDKEKAAQSMIEHLNTVSYELNKEFLIKNA